MTIGVAKLAAATLAFGMLAAGPALAAGKLKENCKDEIAKFCATAAQGAPLLQCLSAKKAELSDKCKTHVDLKASDTSKKK